MNLMRAGCNHIGRYGDDGGARRDRALRRFHRHVAARVDRGRRRRQLDRDPLGESRDAACRIPGGRTHRYCARPISRNRPRILGSVPCRSRMGRARIRSPAASRRDRSAAPARRLCRPCAPRRRCRDWRAPAAPGNPPARLRAHSACRSAPSGSPVPDRLRCRAAASSLVTRIDIGRVDPVRAAVVRNVESAVSVTQRPPMWSAASISTNFRPAAAIRRAAAIPAAPAPTMTTSVGVAPAAPAPNAAGAASAAEAARNERRLIRDMVSKLLAARQIARMPAVRKRLIRLRQSHRRREPNRNSLRVNHDQ